jgi:hypothetical protein
MPGDPHLALVGPNPVLVPVADGEVAWNQIVDTVDDYFKIDREERVRMIGGMPTAGRIDTFPLAGATLLEPWRRDSTGGFERLHSTLQSVRRRAVVHVVPVEQGYSVEVIVMKELEDLDRPEQSPVGQIGVGSLMYDDSPGGQQRNEPGGPLTLGWISLGRDISLEQRILAEIQGRMANVPSLRAM